MKRTLLVLVAVLASAVCFGQTKEEEAVKEKAKTYFETVFVPQAFKDKYSYKLMDIKVVPRTKEDEIRLAKVMALSDSISYDTVGYMSKYQMLKPTYEAVLNRHNKKFRKDTVSQSYRESLERVNKSYDLIKPIKDKFIAASKAKKNADDLLRQLTPAEKAIVMYYRINIDCYGNNSYGNKVLGMYSFDVSRNGDILSLPYKTN